MTGKQIDYLEIAEAYEAEAESERSKREDTICWEVLWMLKAHARVYRRLAYPKKPGAPIEDFTQNT